MDGVVRRLPQTHTICLSTTLFLEGMTAGQNTHTHTHTQYQHYHEPLSRTHTHTLTHSPPITQLVLIGSFNTFLPIMFSAWGQTYLDTPSILSVIVSMAPFFSAVLAAYLMVGVCLCSSRRFCFSSPQRHPFSFLFSVQPETNQLSWGVMFGLALGFLGLVLVSVDDIVTSPVAMHSPGGM